MVALSAGNGHLQQRTPAEQARSGTIDLRALLFHAINDASFYSALVPWVLAAENTQVPSLGQHIEQRQVLQQYQLQQAGAQPRDMRQCVLQVLQECCSHARGLAGDACPTPGEQQGGTCRLSQPATRLAKLHGHLLAHGLAPNLAEQLQLLALLLVNGPLLPAATISSSSHNNSSKRQPAAKSSAGGKSAGSSPAALAGAKPATAALQAVSCAEELLSCKACAARYAAKAFECCSKLLCCLPRELLLALAASPHAQLYAPGLTTLLHKAAAAPGHGNPAAAGPGQQLASQPQGPLAATPRGSSPASARQAGGSNLTGQRPPSTGPGSAGSSRSTPAGRPGGGSKLSGLGLLLPNTPAGSAGRLPSAGAAGRGVTATLNNREKCRDLFFSILRRCSSRLEGLRQQQAGTAGLDGQQQQDAAAAVFGTELAELTADVGLAAKQLLLQLAPSNQAYLAELFTACVLQAASSGEPILEPQLALMAERDPQRFHKLQQRLADRGGGARLAPSAQQPEQLQPQQVAAKGATPGSADKAKPQTAVQAAAAAAGGTNRASKHDPAAAAAKKPDSSSIMPEAVQQPWQQQQQFVNAACGSPASQQPAVVASFSTPSSCVASTQQRIRLLHQQQHQQHQHILAALPGACNNSSGGSGHTLQKPATHSGARSSQCRGPQQQTPDSAGGTSSSLRLAAAAGMTTPLPFAACGVPESPAAAAASPAVPAAGPPAFWHQQQRQGACRSTERLHAGQCQQQQQQHTPASAPPTVPVAAAAAARIAGPSRGLGPDRPSQASSGSQVLLQLLSEQPAGQHVLLLVLHAADSCSFNRSLLTVMLDRAERLLCSCPDSLAAAGGMGQQAAAAVALASYCSYLTFVAGCTEEPQRQQQLPPAADAAGVDTGGPLLQQQPLIDAVGLLTRVLASASSSSSSEGGVDKSWRLGLSVPFVCQFLQFAPFNPSAAASSCVVRVLRQLQQLQELPCMAAGHANYGSLPAALSSCLRSCQLLQQRHHQLQGEGGGVATAALQPLDCERLCCVLGQGSSLVDSTYWSVCCPGLQQLSSMLANAAAAAQRQPHRMTEAPASKVPASAAASAHAQHAAALASTKQQAQQVAPTPAPIATALAAADTGGAAAVEGSAGAAACTPAATSSAGSSPASAGAVLRHTRPLLLAPRAPPVLEAPPPAITAALADVADPLKQQLQQAFIGQYSTDDMPVKMRDVLALVNGILCANSLSCGLSQGLPGELQRHVAAMEQRVRQQLAPSAAPGAAQPAQLEDQELARAVHSICARHSGPAVHAALDAAMQAAAAHADEAAASACAALLPADVPPAAVGAAAALVAASCKASCAQRLLQDVPVLVQSALANQADELVRLVRRQWAVHCRMTAAPPAAAAAASSSCQGGSGQPAACSAAVSSRRPVRRQVDLLGPAAAAAAAAAASPGTAPSTASCSSSRTAGARRIDPVPVQPAAVTAAGDDKPASQCLAAIPAENAGCKACDGSSGAHAAQQAQQAATGRSAGATSDDRAGAPPPPGRGSTGLTGPPAAAVTAQLVRACCSSRLASAALLPAGLLEQLQAGLAAAVSQSQLQAAVEAYQAAAAQLLPASVASVSSGKPEQQQQPVGADACGTAWQGVVAAAELAAAALVAGVAAGAYALPDLEQQLLAVLDEPVTPAGGAAGEQQQALGHLLCGAALQAFLNNSQQQEAVWGAPAGAAAAGAQAAACGGVAGSTGSSSSGGSSSSSGMAHLTSLPARLMKAVRGDSPEWLLRQLRVWLQGATLGYRHV